MKAVIYSIFTVVLLAFLPSCTTEAPSTEPEEKQTTIDPNLVKNRLPKDLSFKMEQMRQNPQDHNRNSQNVNDIASFYLEKGLNKKAVDILKTGIIFHSKGNKNTDNIKTLVEALRTNPGTRQDYINIVQALQIGNPTLEGLDKYKKDVPSGEASVKSKIESIQKNLTVTSTGRLDIKKVNEFVNIVEYFVIANPTNDQSPVYLKLAAEVVNSVKVYPRAIQFYDWILTGFPDSKQAAQALFMKGFTLDDGMKNKQAAKPIYEEFLKKYPKNDFADDTQFLLNNIGKSDEEIIKQFDKKK